MRAWHPPTHRWRAVLIPAAAAGAVFTVASGTFFVLESNATKVLDSGAAAALLGGLVIGTPVGFFLALLPMSVGVLAMHWLGSWNLGLRHPAAWALAGGGMAALILIALNRSIFDQDFGPATGFVATGTLCALLARGYVRWPSEEE